MTRMHVAQTSLVAASMLLVGAAHADLVTNGGFETGTFAGWTVDLAPVGSSLSVFADSTPFGTHYASFSANAGAYDSISQLLATTAGTEYTVSFWVNNLGIENDSLVIDWEGATAQSYTPLGTGLESWEFISFNVLATQDGSLFRIRGFDSQSAIGIDAISVVAVPAPGAMVAMALAGAIRSRRRRV